MATKDKLVTLEELKAAYDACAHTGNLTDEYSASATYAVGDYCIHDNTLYRCTTAITTAEAWTAAHWTETTVDAELKARVGFGDVVDNLTNPSATTVPSSAAVADIIGANNAGLHNSIFRGKYLGNSLTAAQSAQIQAGTFNGMYVGDYWTINGVNWRIADFDPYYRCGDNVSLGHHIAVVPDTSLYDAMWNDANTTEGGYVASKIRTNIKSNTNDSTEGAELKVIAAFGSSHVLSYRAMYPSTYDSSGNATNWAWVDARVELMNENEVYGAQVWSVGGKGYEVGINKRQLSLFRHAPQHINIREHWWLRSVFSALSAACVNLGGYANFREASFSFGVRPFALIA